MPTSIIFLRHLMWQWPTARSCTCPRMRWAGLLAPTALSVRFLGSSRCRLFPFQIWLRPCVCLNRVLSSTTCTWPCYGACDCPSTNVLTNVFCRQAPGCGRVCNDEAAADPGLDGAGSCELARVHVGMDASQGCGWCRSSPRPFLVLFLSSSYYFWIPTFLFGRPCIASAIV